MFRARQVRSIEARWCRAIAPWLALSCSLACGDHVIVGREVLTIEARDAAVPAPPDAGPTHAQAVHAERARGQASKSAHEDSKSSDNDEDKGH